MGTLAQHRLVAAADRVAARLGHVDAAIVLPALDDASLIAGLRDITEARNALDVLTALFTAEVEVRSTRELGHTGLAQRTGHRTGTDLVQHVTGQTRTDVIKATRTGRDLVAAMPGRAPTGAEDDSAPPASLLWFSPLTDALRDGRLSREAFDAVRRGLGEPPEDRYPDLKPGILTGAWREAAVALIAEAAERNVEDLAQAARLARDSLDPIGTRVREERFAGRSWSMWVDASGQYHAPIRFDDEAAAWVRTILNAALRPRRGPRFVDASERTEPDAGAVNDDRTNEQLQYDTMVAILRTGANADPAQAFGGRQPGIRIVTTADAVEKANTDGRVTGVGYCEEIGQAMPDFILETYLCNAATQIVTVDASGSPLDVGREKRLFTKRQRTAMAVRDGGCLWCGVEPSRCEAHHIVEWANRGRTDTRDGVLLCRNCHMRLHNQGWRIQRQGITYRLHPPHGPDGLPSAPSRELKPRSLLRFRTPPAA